jgi:hypothetical protein
MQKVVYVTERNVWDDMGMILADRRIVIESLIFGDILVRMKGKVVP